MKQFINMVFFVAPNVYTIVHACGWFDAFVFDSTFIRCAAWLPVVLSRRGRGTISCNDPNASRQ